MQDRFKDKEASNYDDVIRRRVPLYSEMQSLMASLLPFSKKEYLRILDLGCGTGNTSVSILKEFPLARVTGIDRSQAMLDLASGKVKHTTWRADFLCHDLKIAGGQWPVAGVGEFDVIVSAFSLHYLDLEEKEEVFRRCLELLKPGGVLIDAEAVRTTSEKMYQSYLEKWKDFQRSNGFTDEEIASHMLRFIRDVKPLTVEKQIDMMAKAGFVDVDCCFRYFNFALFVGNR